MSAPRIAVVGAGAFGGWTALHLQRRGARVTLYDAWGPGNPRSSSGGETRVLRAVYGPDRIYAEMVARALPLWRELETALPEPLYVETGALWLHRGDDGYVRASAGILGDLGLPLRELALPDARAAALSADLLRRCARSGSSRRRACSRTAPASPCARP